MTDVPPLPETKVERDERMAAAQRAHDQRQKAAEITADQVKAFSVLAMRAPALVSAGGVVAALGFYSANYERLSSEASRLATFNDILFWLFLSLFLSSIAPALAYFSQLAYQDSLNSEELNYESPYVRDTRRSSVGERIGDACRWLAVLVTAVSIVFLALGGYQFLELVR